MSEILSSIRAIMASTPQRWAQLAALPEERLRERPAPGEWSAVECLQHMVNTERLGFSVRLAALRRGEDIPALGAEDITGQSGPPLTMAALLATFTELRAANLAVLAQVGEHELARGGAHSELGPVTVGELLHEWAAHDFDHTIQAERALMQPFIRGCGPWQPFFAANRIDQPA